MNPTPAAHSYLHGNQLPARWAGRARFVIVDTAFGQGQKFLATWQVWREDPARLRLGAVEQRANHGRAEQNRRLACHVPHPALVYRACGGFCGGFSGRRGILIYRSSTAKVLFGRMPERRVSGGVVRVSGSYMDIIFGYYY